MHWACLSVSWVIIHPLYAAYMNNKRGLVRGSEHQKLMHLNPLMTIIRTDIKRRFSLNWDTIQRTQKEARGWCSGGRRSARSRADEGSFRAGRVTLKEWKLVLFLHFQTSEKAAITLDRIFASGSSSFNVKSVCRQDLWSICWVWWVSEHQLMGTQLWAFSVTWSAGWNKSNMAAQ